MSRELEDNYEFRTLQQAVKNVDSSMEAAEAVRNAFAQTNEAEAGWELIGPPCAFEITYERIAGWEGYIRPEPVNIPKRPSYLRPVDD